MLDIKLLSKEGFLQMALKDSKVPRRITESSIEICCGKHSTKQQFDVLRLPDDTPCILGRDILQNLGIGLTKLPFHFPGEFLSSEEPYEILSEATALAKLNLEDQEPRIPEQIAIELQENCHLDPSKPCTIPTGGYRLRLKNGSKPVFRRQYNLNPTKQSAMDETVAKWIETGVVRRCTEGSPYNSPLITVPKRDEFGTKTGVRVCIDPRPINEILEEDDFLVPLVTEVFQRTADAKYFSTIDLKDAFTQIALSTESQPLTAFTWKGLQYVFTRCIFGIKTMTSMFQRVISNVLENCMEYCMAYVDDIVIFSDSAEEHITHIKSVLKALTNANLRVNAGKSKFGHKCVKLLGFIIDERGITPDPNRLKHIFNFPSPNNIKELQRFLGMCNYIRQHIPNYTAMSRRLERACTTSQLSWQPELEEDFTNIKKAIANAQLLSTPKKDLPFFLATDASNDGIASMLYQIDGDQTLYISFDSRSLRPAETRYHAHKKELLAVVFGLLKNKNILSSRKFTLLTDHQSLTYLFTQKHANIMMENWMDIIASFNFTPCHLPGSLNVIPDALSRAPIPTLLVNPDTSPEPQFDLKALHNLGHFQEEQMVSWLKDRGYTWNNMLKECSEVAKSCLICQRFNNASIKHNPLTTIDASKPFDHVQIDLVTYLPLSGGFSTVLILTDVASKFSLLKPLPDKSAKSVAESLLLIISDFGPPAIIQSDQGREFVNQVIRELCTAFAIDHRLANAYSPRTNGLVERTNHTWLQIIRKLSFFCQQDWPHLLPVTQLILNTRIAAPIGISPFEAMFLRQSNLLVDYKEMTIPTAPDEKTLLDTILYAHNHFWPSLRKKSEIVHNDMAEKFNENNRLTSFATGDLVYVRTQPISKLDPPFDGPYKIVDKTQAGSYRLEDIHGTPYHRLVTTSQLKPARLQAPETDSSADIFEIESILRHRGSPGNYEYLVKWKRFPRSEASWVKQEDFTDPLFLKKYWLSQGG